MNYLGHIFFSENNLELMHANLFGDFVKGKNLDKFNPIVQQGIRLHRSIDFYIGNHDKVRKLQAHLSSVLPKVSSIAVDIYFDHFLVKHWEKYHLLRLEEFLNQFYNYKIVDSDYPNDLFLQIIYRMKKGRWMIEYGNLNGVHEACVSVSRRLSFDNELINGREVLANNYSIIEETFFQYMDDAIIQFENKNS